MIRRTRLQAKGWLWYVPLDVDRFVGGKRTAGSVSVSRKSAAKYLRARDVDCIVHFEKGFSRLVVQI